MEPEANPARPPLRGSVIDAAEASLGHEHGLGVIVVAELARETVFRNPPPGLSPLSPPSTADFAEGSVLSAVASSQWGTAVRAPTQ